MTTGGTTACRVPSSGMVTEGLPQHLEQERLDSSSARSTSSISSTAGPRPGVVERGQQRPGRAGGSSRNRSGLAHLLVGRLGQPDREQLARVVPLVERLGRGDALVALQPDQHGVERLGDRLGGLGLPDARSRPPAASWLPHPHREEQRRRELVPGHVAGLVERRRQASTSETARSPRPRQRCSQGGSLSPGTAGSALRPSRQRRRAAHLTTRCAPFVPFDRFTPVKSLYAIGSPPGGGGGSWLAGQHDFAPAIRPGQRRGGGIGAGVLLASAVVAGCAVSGSARASLAAAGTPAALGSGPADALQAAVRGRDQGGAAVRGPDQHRRRAGVGRGLRRRGRHRHQRPRGRRRLDRAGHAGRRRRRPDREGARRLRARRPRGDQGHVRRRVAPPASSASPATWRRADRARAWQPARPDRQRDPGHHLRDRPDADRDQPDRQRRDQNPHHRRHAADERGDQQRQQRRRAGRPLRPGDRPADGGGPQRRGRRFDRHRLRHPGRHRDPHRRQLISAGRVSEPGQATLGISAGNAVASSGHRDGATIASCRPAARPTRPGCAPVT